MDNLLVIISILVLANLIVSALCLYETKKCNQEEYEFKPPKINKTNTTITSNPTIGSPNKSTITPRKTNSNIKSSSDSSNLGVKVLSVKQPKALSS